MFIKKGSELTKLSTSSVNRAWSRDMTAESNQALFLAASSDEFLLLVRPMSMVGFSLLRRIWRLGNAKEEGGSTLLSVTSTGNVRMIDSKSTAYTSRRLGLDVATYPHLYIEA